MMIGNRAVFAIESEITRAYERLSFRALGFFVLHVGGRRYGVYKPEATMLANSFDEVQERIAFRGKHTAPFASEPDGGAIADAFRNAIYADEQEESFFGIPLAQFSRLFYTTSDLAWAPDGDEAFDDGSHVLQFDVDSRIRLIAFKNDDGYRHDAAPRSDNGSQRTTSAIFFASGVTPSKPNGCLLPNSPKAARRMKHVYLMVSLE
jgi:Immunity protein 42